MITLGMVRGSRKAGNDTLEFILCFHQGQNMETAIFFRENGKEWFTDQQLGEACFQYIAFQCMTGEIKAEWIDFDLLPPILEDLAKQENLTVDQVIDNLGGWLRRDQ